GSGSVCSPRSDTVARAQMQNAATTTASDGTWSVTWARTMASQPIVQASSLENSQNAGNCKVKTRSTTGATGVCFVGATLTVLGVSVTLLSTSPAGVPVMVTAAEATQ